MATNAIGMGMNLNIKRIIFMQLQRPDGLKSSKLIDDYELKQIAGRAGR